MDYQARARSSRWRYSRTMGGQFCWSDRNYYLVYPEGKAENAALATFRGWLQQQAESYRIAAGLNAESGGQKAG